MSASAVSLSDVTKRYGRATVLDRVSRQPAGAVAGAHAVTLGLPSAIELVAGQFVYVPDGRERVSW